MPSRKSAGPCSRANDGSRRPAMPQRGVCVRPDLKPSWKYRVGSPEAVAAIGMAERGFNLSAFWRRYPSISSKQLGARGPAVRGWGCRSQLAGRLAAAGRAIAEPALVHEPERERSGAAFWPPARDRLILPHHARNRQDRHQQVARATLGLLAQ